MKITLDDEKRASFCLDFVKIVKRPESLLPYYHRVVNGEDDRTCAEKYLT